MLLSSWLHQRPNDACNPSVGIGIEEILYRVPTLSLIRFKIVCKQWNTLFKSKSFVNNHLVRVRPQFLLWTDSKMYSVSVNLNNDPKIDMRELPLDISYLNNCSRTSFTPCDGLLFCDSWSWENKAAVWNPWLRQTKWIESEDKHFLFRGIGYDSGRPEKGARFLGQVLVSENSVTIHSGPIQCQYTEELISTS